MTQLVICLFNSPNGPGSDLRPPKLSMILSFIIHYRNVGENCFDSFIFLRIFFQFGWLKLFLKIEKFAKLLESCDKYIYVIYVSETIFSKLFDKIFCTDYTVFPTFLTGSVTTPWLTVTVTVNVIVTWPASNDQKWLIQTVSGLSRSRSRSWTVTVW